MFVSPDTISRTAPPSASIQNLIERAHKTRDAQEQLALQASIACYALRDAMRAVDACIDFMAESKAVRDDLRARKISIDDKIGDAKWLRERIAEHKAGFEVLAYGRAEAPTKFVRDEIEAARGSMSDEQVAKTTAVVRDAALRQFETIVGLKPGALDDPKTRDAVLGPNALLQELSFKELPESVIVYSPEEQQPAGGPVG